MLISQEFSESEELPPRMFMDQIMDAVSKLYCFLWDRRDEDNKFRVTWKEISVYFNKNNFRTGLRKLNSKALLSYEETSDGVLIELVGWNEVISE